MPTSTNSVVTPASAERSTRGSRLLSFAAVLVMMLVAMVVVWWVRPADRRHPDPLIPVRLLVGTENQPFFNDPRVVAAFEQQGYQLQVDGEGSRQMATDDRTCHYDLALPSSGPAADKVTDFCHAPTKYPAFSSPMVVSTFDDVVQALQLLHIATQDTVTKLWMFDVQRYISVVRSGQRWNTITGNRTYNYSQNQVLLNTTDPKYSNSSEMYIAMLCYLLNGNSVVSRDQQANALASMIGSEFIDPLGYLPSSTQYPFEDYLGSLGEAETPMLVAYEAQFLDIEMNHPNQIANNHMIMMYPTTTADAIHTAVPMTSAGDRIGQLLSGQVPDPEILRLEAEHGFRTNDTADTFSAVMKQRRINVLPAAQMNTARLPAYRYLEDLLNGI